MENMTKKQLQEVATRKGVTFTSKTTKEELIKAIEAKSVKAEVGKSTSGEY